MSNFTLAGLRNVADELRAAYYPKNETERKVYEALSSLKNWGASTTLLNDIAADTFDYEKYPIVMTTIWNLVSSEGRTWKQLFKALSLLEFLVKSGAERCIEDMRDHMRSIRALQEYNFYEGNVDKGGGVREKAGQLISLLGSNESIREEREKARRLRDKFVGISNNGYGGSASGRGGDSYSSGGNRDYGGSGSGRDRYSNESYSGGSSSSSGRYNSRYGNESNDRNFSDSGGYGNGGIDSYANGGIASSKKASARYGGGSYDTENRSRYSDEPVDTLDSRNSPRKNVREEPYSNTYSSRSDDATEDFSSKKGKIKINIKDTKSSRTAVIEPQPREEVDLFADPTPAAAPLFDAFSGPTAALATGSNAGSNTGNFFDDFSSPAPQPTPASYPTAAFDPFTQQPHYAAPVPQPSAVPVQNMNSFNAMAGGSHYGQYPSPVYQVGQQSAHFDQRDVSMNNSSNTTGLQQAQDPAQDAQDFGDFEGFKPAAPVAKSRPVNDWSNLVNLDDMNSKSETKNSSSHGKKNDGNDSFSGLDGFSKPQQNSHRPTGSSGAPLSAMGVRPMQPMGGSMGHGSAPIGGAPIGYPMSGQMSGGGYYAPNQMGVGPGYNPGMMPQGMPPHGMPPQGMPPQGMPMPPQGMQYGMPPQHMGYNPSGQPGYHGGMPPPGGQPYRY